MQANNQIFKGKSLHEGPPINNERSNQTSEDFEGFLVKEMKDKHLKLKKPVTNWNANWQTQSKAAILAELASTNH